MKTTIKVCQDARAIYRKPSHVFPPNTPLWGKPMLPHMNTVPDPSMSAKKGITTLKHVILNGRLMSFQELRRFYSLPGSFQFRYWLLRHAFGAQFVELVVLESYSIERLLTFGVMGRPLSSLYSYLMVSYDTKPSRSLDKWKMYIPNLDDDIWEDCVSSFIPSMIAAKDIFIQFKFLHRVYYTPQRLSRIYPQMEPTCPRCTREIGSFWHMVWSCCKLRPYWEAVAMSLSDLFGTNVPLDPLVMLLGHLEEVEGDRYTKLCITFCLFCAIREILLRWKSVEPPTPASWRQSINAVLSLYRLTYESR